MCCFILQKCLAVEKLFLLSLYFPRFTKVFIRSERSWTLMGPCNSCSVFISVPIYQFQTFEWSVTSYRTSYINIKSCSMVLNLLLWYGKIKNKTEAQVGTKRKDKWKFTNWIYILEWMNWAVCSFFQSTKPPHLFPLPLWILTASPSCDQWPNFWLSMFQIFIEIQISSFHVCAWYDVYFE